MLDVKANCDHAGRIEGHTLTPPQQYCKNFNGSVCDRRWVPKGNCLWDATEGTCKTDPRCVHVGRCGGLSFRLDAELGTQEERAAACNVTRDAQDFAAIWVAPWRRGGPFAVPKLSATPPDNARSAWRVDDGLKLCRGRYTPANASAALVGVARGNNATSSAFGEQLCLTMLRAAT